MVVDGLWRSFPSGALVLEVANQLTLLGIYADDGQAALGELHALLGDVLKLLVAVWAGSCRDALVVDAQPVVKVLEDAGDGPGTDLDVEGSEFCCDLLGGTAGPADTGDGVAGDIVLQCRFDGSDHLGSFFSRGGRPPPGRRTRPRSTSWASSCLRPRATVPGSIPSNPAIRASPPQPHLRDSRPAYSRRWRSSSKLANSTIAARSSSGMRSASGIGPSSPGAASRARRALSCCALRVRSAAQYRNWPASFLAGQLALLDELAQDILSADVKQVVQLLAEMSGWRIADQRCGGGEQGAGGREPHVARNDHSPCWSKSMSSSRV